MLECQSLSNYYQMSISLISGGDGFVIVIAKKKKIKKIRNNKK